MLYALAGVAAFLLWPTSLGGCTTLTIVSGHSMEPTYYTGDLVIARCGTASVGDVIVYQPKDLGGARIIHRIVSGDATTGWTMKGDNNPSADPFNPGSSEVLGVAKVYLPKVGLIARGLTSPFVWGSFILIAIGLFVWPRAEESDDAAVEARDDDETPASVDADGAAASTDVDAGPTDDGLVPDPDADAAVAPSWVPTTVTDLRMDLR
ncbi:MAG: signal peptidase I [Cellulomonas sp.]